MRIVNDLTALRERIEERIKGMELTPETLSVYLALSVVSSAIAYLLNEIRNAEEHLKDVAS